MRKNLFQAQPEEEAEINLTPMLDVVFIMLIFFIVTASFVKESGLDVNRPDAPTAVKKENESDRKSCVFDFCTDIFFPIFIVGVSGRDD